MKWQSHWNQVYDLEKDPVRKYLIHPYLLKKQIKNKIVLDAGCGNGSLIVKLLKKEPKKIIGLDQSKEFLSFAQKNIQSKKVQFIKKNLLQPLNLPKNYFDFIFTVFVFSEIKNIRQPIQQFYKHLKKKGKLIIVTLHPTYAYSYYLYEKYTGKKNKKIKNVKEYFNRFKGEYVLTIARDSVPFYHHTIEDYLSTVLEAGFQITKYVEEFPVKNLIKKSPDYQEDFDVPKFLIIECQKR